MTSQLILPTTGAHAEAERSRSALGTHAGGLYRPLRYVVLAALLVIAFAQSAVAQSRLPGLVVTTPPAASTPPAEPRKPVTQPRREQPRSRSNSARRPSAKRRKRSGANNRSGRRSGTAKLAISLLVNDDPITNFEITERARLLAMSANVKNRAQANFRSLVTSKRVNDRLKALLRKTIDENRGKSREQIIAIFNKRKQAFGRSLQQRALASARSSAVSGLKKKARQELIDERLKLQEAKRLGLKPPEDRVKQIFSEIAQRNKMTPKQFAAQLRRTGASAESMKARFRAQLAWNLVINRRFRRLVSVSQRDIDQFIDRSGDDKSVTVRLQKVTIPVAANLEQRDLAKRMSDAEALRQRFRGCNSTAALVRRLSGAQLKDMGSVSPSKMSEPTRSMLLSANEGDMLPPSLASGGIELFAVCSKSSKGSLEDRMAASRRIENQELTMLGRRHLADLKRDAHIERR